MKVIKMTKWLNTKDLPKDDGDYLVAWKDWEGKYCSPIRAYWVSEELAFFATDSRVSFPLKVDIFMKMPEVPNS